MTKMTYVQALENALTLVTDVETRDKLTALRDQLVKRNSAPSKPTKVQVANEGVKATILAALTNAGRPLTVTEVQDTDADLAALSNQKVSALLTQMIAAGVVVKTVDKRKSYFAPAACDALSDEITD